MTKEEAANNSWKKYRKQQLQDDVWKEMEEYVVS